MRLYRCFSANQKNFLLNKGLRFIFKAKDFYTDKTFWVFDKTEFLDICLKEWSETKPSNVVK